MYQTVSGALAILSIVPALFFWRSWQRLGDRFFLLFSIAFLILGVERFLMGASDLPEARNVALYWIRFAGFALIILAIVDKNRSRKRQ